MALVTSLVIAALKKTGRDFLAEHSPAETFARHLDDSSDRTLRDLSLSAYNAVAALLAHELQRPPTDPEIANLMNEAAESSAFPARAFLLLGAARRTASARRRAMLCAALYGLPFTALRGDERDRVDMLVERLFPEDIQLLGTIAALEDAGPVRKGKRNTFILAYDERRLLIGNDLVDRSDLRDDDLAAAPDLTTPAYTTLLTTGCLWLPNFWGAGVTISGKHASAEYLAITSLGRLLLTSLECIRHGFEQQGT